VIHDKDQPGYKGISQPTDPHLTEDRAAGTVPFDSAASGLAD
jgi:hypothetical protein